MNDHGGDTVAATVDDAFLERFDFGYAVLFEYGDTAFCILAVLIELAVGANDSQTFVGVPFLALGFLIGSEFVAVEEWRTDFPVHIILLGARPPLVYGSVDNCRFENGEIVVVCR